jgi:outer membrane biosynthesis protein TonB
MRYVMFNLLVVGALAFLLFDGNPPTTVRGAVDKIADKAEQMVEKGKALVQPTETEPAKPETVVVQRVPEPVAAPAKPEPVAKVKAPVVAPAPKRVAKPARPLPPDVAKRRAEVLGEAAAVVAEAPAAPTFMTPRVRRGELAKLAEDMRHAAEELRFEDAARLRDRLVELERLELAR